MKDKVILLKQSKVQEMKEFSDNYIYGIYIKDGTLRFSSDSAYSKLFKWKPEVVDDFIKQNNITLKQLNKISKEINIFIDKNVDEYDSDMEQSRKLMHLIDSMLFENRLKEILQDDENDQDFAINNKPFEEFNKLIKP